MKHGEGHGESYKRIQGKKTLREILEVAVEFERTARDFYTDLIPKVSQSIRWLVEDLATEEQEHFDLFTNLMNNPDIESQIHTEVTTPTQHHRFSDCIDLPDLGADPDQQSILQYALGREHAAMQQYQELAASAPDGPIKDLFQFLAFEESKHKNELERIYYEVVETGVA